MTEHRIFPPEKLRLPGVPAGQKPPTYDYEILVSPGHVLGARLRDFVGRRYVLSQALLLGLGALAIGHFLHAPTFGQGSTLQSQVVENWPSPLHREPATFSPWLYPALPSTVAVDVNKINAAFRADGDDAPRWLISSFFERSRLKKLPAGLTVEAASGLFNPISNWISNTGLNADMATTAAIAALPSSLTITRNEHFLDKMTPANLAGGLLSIPTGPLQNTTSAMQTLTQNPGGYGPFFFGAIINHEVGLYVLTMMPSAGLSCVTITGPAVGPCAAASQAYVDDNFSVGSPEMPFGGFGYDYLSAMAGINK